MSIVHYCQERWSDPYSGQWGSMSRQSSHIHRRSPETTTDNNEMQRTTAVTAYLVTAFCLCATIYTASNLHFQRRLQMWLSP